MRKIIIANWKMHPDTPDAAVALAADIEKELPSPLGADVVVAPPLPFLMPVAAVLKKSSLGAQDMAAGEENKALTGGVSGRMLASLGARYVIVGHSERRILCAETDEMVNQKIRTALAQRIAPILCIGEREAAADISGEVSDAVRAALTGVKKESLKNLIVAYEPVWAISTRAGFAGADTPERIFRARLTIEKAIAASFDAAAAKNVRIVYGGSVDAANAAAIIGEGHMDGVLVGGVSLRAQEFGEVVRRVAETK